MNKLLVALAIITSVSGFYYFKQTQSLTVAKNSLQAYDIRYKPKRLVIPALNINASVEHVGEDEAGNMAAPQEWDDVGWYKLGVKPGEVGQAVIAGHYDSDTGAAVFVDLAKLKADDSVFIVDQTGITREFAVTRVATFPDSEFPLKSVFGASKEKRLNLITCSGVFNQNIQQYSHRIVVFTKLVDK